MILVKKKKSTEDELQEEIKEHNKSYDRWEQLYTYGGQDPFYSDGMNLMLVNNHIIYHKSRIKELCEKSGCEPPKEYFKDVPPEVDRDYMAREDEIRTNAKNTLKTLKTSPEYKELLHLSARLTKKQSEDLYVSNMLKTIPCLESSIENRDLVTMRRYENPDLTIISFKEGIKRVKELKSREKQMSIFDFTT